MSDGEALLEEIKAKLTAFRDDETVRRRPYPAEIRELVTSYAQIQRAEGVSLDKIARELGISAMTLWGWATPGARSYRNERRKVLSGKSASAQSQPSLKVLPVQVRGSSSVGLEVELGNGVRLRFAAGTDPGYVRSVLSALGSC